MPSIGLVCNLYNECNALPGWLECHTPYFDDIRVFHAGPGGAYSDDGTIEILEKWRVPVEFGAIDEGFGIVRTKTIRMCPCDWVMLLDVDERFHQYIRVMTCTGESTPREDVDALLYDYGNPNYQKDGPKARTLKQVVQPYDADVDFTACPSNFENLWQLGAKLTVTQGEVCNQGAWLRAVIKDSDLDAVKVVRRHWHDFTFRRPTQNWHTDPDYQMRLLRRNDSIRFAQDTRMHERVEGAEKVHDPDFTRGPFFDHYHLFFKKMEAEQRQHDLAIYNAINNGEVPPSTFK
jgi:hypothetical protein